MSLLELRQKIQERITLIQNRKLEEHKRMGQGYRFERIALEYVIELLDFELASIQKRKKELEKEVSRENNRNLSIYDRKEKEIKLLWDELSRITGEKK